MRYSWLFLCVLVTFWLFDVVGLVNVTVDDQDPRLTYSEEWIHTTGKDYFNQTISLSAAGGFVSYTFVGTYINSPFVTSLRFPMTGTQIYAFGTHYAPASVSNYMFTYRIDDQAIVENYVDFSLEDQRLHRHLLFTSGPLLSHEHTLTLANASGSAGFGLDFLIVTTLAGSQNETQIPTATTTVQSSGTSGTIAVIPKPKLITTSSIVALSFGGLAIILIAIFGVLYCRSLKQPANSRM